MECQIECHCSSNNNVLRVINNFRLEDSYARTKHLEVNPGRTIRSNHRLAELKSALQKYKKGTTKGIYVRPVWEPVLWIRIMLMRIQIRILGYASIDTDPDLQIRIGKKTDPDPDPAVGKWFLLVFFLILGFSSYIFFF